MSRRTRIKNEILQGFVIVGVFVGTGIVAGAWLAVVAATYAVFVP